MCFEIGRWAEAETHALEALRLVRKKTITSLPALVTLGHLKVRQGNLAAGELLEDAYALALSTHELQRHAPVAAARAEAAWLSGQSEQIPVVAGLGYALALDRNDPWVLSQVAYWMWRAGRDAPLERLAPPYALMVRGEWAAAAEVWAQIGCPYEQALALAEGDEPAQRRALAIFDELGARPAADWLRQRLRAQGALHLPPTPKLPRPVGADDLTPREIEVLRLIAAGLSNPAIAEQLTISVGTVKAHTGSIYSKLGVNNRVQALARGRELRLL
jgi:DNA-binding CsgD family transcriptional regulator